MLIRTIVVIVRESKSLREIFKEYKQKGTLYEEMIKMLTVAKSYIAHEGKNWAWWTYSTLSFKRDDRKGKKESQFYACEYQIKEQWEKIQTRNLKKILGDEEAMLDFDVYNKELISKLRAKYRNRLFKNLDVRNWAGEKMYDERA